MTRTASHAAPITAILSAFLLPPPVHAQDRIGEIVQPATGTDRAIYAPMDQATILPRFRGKWAVHSGKCARQKILDRMELRQSRAFLGGQGLRVQVALVEAGSFGENGDRRAPRARDHADASDLLVGFDQPNGGDRRYIHFRFAGSNGRLIVEETGKPRRAYVRCS